MAYVTIRVKTTVGFQMPFKCFPFVAQVLTASYTIMADECNTRADHLVTRLNAISGLPRTQIPPATMGTQAHPPDQTLRREEHVCVEVSSRPPIAVLLNSGQLHNNAQRMPIRQCHATRHNSIHSDTASANAHKSIENCIVTLPLESQTII